MGNNHPNMIDPDGGDAHTGLVGGAIGAGVGLIAAGVIDYRKDGKLFNQGAGVYIGGAVIGGAVGFAICGLGWDKPGKFDLTKGWQSNFAGDDISLFDIVGNAFAPENSAMCVPACLQAISASFKQAKTMEYFKSQYLKWASISEASFEGVYSNHVKGFIGSEGYKVADGLLLKTKASEVFQSLKQGNRVLVDVRNYGKGNGAHAMVVVYMKLFKNGRFKMTLMNPDLGGETFKLNTENNAQFFQGTAWPIGK
jgi:hypothetical protein